MARSVFPWHVSYEREENRDHTHIQPLTTRYNRMAYRVACLHLALSSGRNIIMAEVTTLGASANGINEWKIISLPIVRSCQHNSNKEPLCAPHAKPNVYLVTLSKWFLLLWLGRSRINGAQEYESPHLGHNSRSTYYLLGEIENLHFATVRTGNGNTECLLRTRDIVEVTCGIDIANYPLHHHLLILLPPVMTFQWVSDSWRVTGILIKSQSVTSTYRTCEWICKRTVICSARFITPGRVHKDMGVWYVRIIQPLIYMRKLLLEICINSLTNNQYIYISLYIIIFMTCISSIIGTYLKTNLI